jgi:hypothetical protein
MKKIENNSLALIEAGLSGRQCLLLGMIAGAGALGGVWPVAGGASIAAVVGGCFT